jgi:hypothetical protein
MKRETTIIISILILATLFLSIPCANKMNRGHIDPLFSPVQVSLWTGDTYNDWMMWVVSFDYGSAFKESMIDKMYVRPVRSQNIDSKEI